MSIEPVKDRITLRQGATFDQTWQFNLPQTDEEVAAGEDPTPEDFSAWSGKAQFRKAVSDGTVIKELVTGNNEGDENTPPEDGIYLDAEGNVRMYLRDETMAAIAHTAWTDSSGKYTGICHVELEEPNGERHRYLELKVTFSREVTL